MPSSGQTSNWVLRAVWRPFEFTWFPEFRVILAYIFIIFSDDIAIGPIVKLNRWLCQNIIQFRCFCKSSRLRLSRLGSVDDEVEAAVVAVVSVGEVEPPVVAVASGEEVEPPVVPALVVPSVPAVVAIIISDEK